MGHRSHYEESPRTGGIAYKKSKIAIGKLISTLERREISDVTVNYDHECVSWTTPITTASTEAVLYSEFHNYAWAAILLSIIFSCVFIYNLSRISPSDHEKKTCIEVTLDVICSTLVISLHRVPTDQPGRIYYISYIFYAMVVTAAYRTSLASILAVKNNMQLIKNEEDIVRSGLIPSGNNNSLSFLQRQRDENSYLP